MFTYYLWIKSIKTGSVYFATFTALSYFYMVSAWGGYVFITNLIPLHVFALILMNRFSHRIYVAYNTFFIVGLICSMQVIYNWLSFLLIRDIVVERWNRRFGCETLHPTQKFTLMNLLQMSRVITWAWSFLISEVVEAVRGQKHHIFSSSCSASSAYQRFKKWDQLWLSASIQPPYLEF